MKRHYYGYQGKYHPDYPDHGLHRFDCKDCRDSWLTVGGVERKPLKRSELKFNPDIRPAVFHNHRHDAPLPDKIES